MLGRNGGTVDIDEAASTAEKIVLGRVSDREPLELQTLVSECEISGPGKNVALCILERFQELTEFPVGRLRPADKLGEVFRVSREDLNRIGIIAVQRFTLWPVGEPLGPFFIAFGYEIVEAAGDCTTRRGWKRQRLALPKPPRNEAEWVETSLEMTLREFLQFFGAACEVS